jgi:hypothetical protein
MPNTQGLNMRSVSITESRDFRVEKRGTSYPRDRTSATEGREMGKGDSPWEM